MSSMALFSALASAGLILTSPPSLQAREPAHTPIVMSYSHVISCAGVTQARSEMEGGESDLGKTLYDAALYWSLTAIQLGQATGRSSTRTESDMTNARIRAVRELHNRDPRALEHFEKCMQSTPDLG